MKKKVQNGRLRLCYPPGDPPGGPPSEIASSPERGGHPMHQPPIPQIDCVRPGDRGPDPQRGTPPGREDAADPVGELRLARRARGDRHGADEQVLRGLPGKRYYEGQQFIDPLETLAIERAKALFGVEHANVQPYSGSPANLAVYLAFARAGRHDHGDGAADGRPPDARLARCAVDRQVVPTPSSTASAARPAGSTWTRCATWRCDERPKVIFAGGTARTRARSTSRRFAEIAREVGAVLVADIAHIAGLIAGGAHPSPVGARAT